MKHKTIDHTLRNVWMAVSKMYQEEAQKLNSTMATGFTLISIDPEQGSPQRHWVQKWVWKQRVFRGFSNLWKSAGSSSANLTLRSVVAC